MADTFTTTTDELAESRVRLRVQVAADEIERRIERQASALGRTLKMPGFRRGKIPAPLVVQRIGREVVFEEAVKGALGEWYAGAVESSGIVPIGDPQVELGAPPEPGQPFSFSIEVGVLPRATVERYKGLEVPRGDPAASEEAVTEEVERLRDRFARLEDVDASADRGDFVVIDHEATLDGNPLEGATGRDQLVELGAGRLLPDLEDGLLGAVAGDSPTVAVTFPADYPNADLAGRTASFVVDVKTVKRKQLPDLDEDFAADAGFDTVDELRADIAARLEAIEADRIDSEYREAALDEVARGAAVEIPQALAQARAAEMWERTLRALARQGISRETYLKITGRTEEQVVTDLVPDAEQALRREAVLTAVVKAEGIVPGDEELLAALQASAHAHDHDHAGHDHAGHDHAGHDHDHDHDHAGHDHDHGDPRAEAEQLMAELRRTGRLEELREELAARQAIDLIARESKPIAAERADARARLWTPGKDSGDVSGGSDSPLASEAPGASGQPGRLWTPGP